MVYTTMTSNMDNFHLYIHWYLKRIALLCFIFCLLNEPSNAQLCSFIPAVSTGAASVPTSCDSRMEGPVYSGSVLTLNLQQGISYTFDVCYNSDYDDPSTNTPMFQLWTTLNGTVADLITEEIGTAEGCATYTFTPCTTAEETIYILTYSHQCIADWKKWDLNISTTCCVLTCAEDVHIGASMGGCRANAFSIPIPSFTGACEASSGFDFTIIPPLTVAPTTASPTSTAIQIPANNPSGTHTILWSVDDCGGTSYTCEQQLYIEPILACNDLIIVSLDATGKSAISVDAVLENVDDICADEFEVFLSDLQGNIYLDTAYCSMIGQTIFYTVRHISTNTICTGLVLVEDKYPPILSCSDVSIKCNEASDVDAIGQATVMDNCTTSPSLIHTDRYTDLNCTDGTRVGFITRTWIATDASGNSSSCVQNIDIQRHTLAEIDLPQDTMIDCSMALANPNITGSPSLMDMELSLPCNIISYFEDDTTYNCVGNYKIIRSWNVLDWCTSASVDHTQIIEVIDTTGPVITCLADVTFGTYVDQCAGSVTLTNPMVMDACSPMTSLSVSWAYGTSIGTYQDIPVGEHLVTYIASDACGNSSSCTQTIEVIDNSHPTAICQLATNVSLTANGDVQICADAFDAGSYDNCAIDSIQISVMGSGVFSECLEFGCIDTDSTVMIIFQITDTVGLSNQCMVELTIKDSAAPNIVCPDDITIDCTADPTDLNLTGNPIVVDNCPFVVDSINVEDFDICGNGTITRTWTVTDNSGNSSSCQQIITIEDTTPPTITFANDTTLFCESLTDDFGRPTIVDDCSIFSYGFQDLVLVNDPCFQKVQRTWFVMDECGSLDTMRSFIAKLENDTLAPTFTGVPANLTLSCEESIPDFDPTINDLCDTSLVIEMMEMEEAGACPNERTIIRNWTATDNCGNIGVFIQTIVVVDTIAPIFTNIPLDTLLSCEQSIPDTPPTITDNCDGVDELTSSMTETIEAGSCPNEQIITRKWLSSDECGNMDSVIQIITIVDTIAPVFLGVPNDTLISCEQTIPFVEPTVSDNCTSNLTVGFSETTTPGDCAAEETIIRTWTAMDECGNATTVRQTIEVFDTTPPMVGNVPPNITINCEDELPIPIFQVINNCPTDFSVDEERDTTGSVCNLIITRTWTVTDACGNSSQTQQVVTKIDTERPTLSVPFNVDADVFIGCSQNVTSLEPATAMDNCDTNLTVITTIDFYNDGIIYNDDFVRNDTVLINESANGVYPLGFHLLTFSVTDQCGNSATAQRVVRVSDIRQPNNGCFSIEVPISNAVDSNVVITTDDVINLDATFDACTDVVYEFASIPDLNLLGDSLIFDCNDLGGQTYAIVVTDEFGNTSACFNGINITNDLDICEDARPGHVIMGKIMTDHHSGVADVAIDMNSSTSQTNQFGVYMIEGIDDGHSCTIAPYKNDDPLNGVSTYDLVLIQQHILGIKNIDNPYRLIAADINNSGSISTADLIELRKLILFIYTEFPNNTSWRFLDSDYTFENPLNPFFEIWSEKQVCSNITESQLNVDFMGVKIGDVDGSAKLNINQNLEVNRNEAVVMLQTNDLYLKKEQSYHLPIYFEEDVNLEGIQFSLAYDANLLRIDDVQLAETMQSGSWAWHKVEEGIVTFSWNTNETSITHSGIPFIHLLFTALNEGQLADGMYLHARYTPAEAYQEGAIMDVDLSFTSTISTATTSIQKQGLQLYQNQPNPFREQTIIPYSIPNASNVRLAIHTLDGQLIYTKEKYTSAGQHYFMVNHADLTKSGIFIYSIQTASEKRSQKMILIE